MCLNRLINSVVRNWKVPDLQQTSLIWLITVRCSKPESCRKPEAYFRVKSCICSRSYGCFFRLLYRVADTTRAIRGIYLPVRRTFLTQRFEMAMQRLAPGCMYSYP